MAYTLKDEWIKQFQAERRLYDQRNELLVALKEATEGLEKGGSKTWIKDCVARCRAAIAKVEGEK